MIEKSNSNQKTFENLYNYIQTATRDSIGVHIISDRYALHIYDGLTQVNVCKKDMYDIYTSIRNFVFQPEYSEVYMYMVKNGICDYDNRIVIPITTPIGTLIPCCIVDRL